MSEQAHPVGQFGIARNADGIVGPVWTWWQILRQREAVELMLAPLNTRLADRPFLLRDTPSLADMAIAPFIRQFAAVEPGWFDCASFGPLQAWMKCIVSSELFDSVMPKFSAWQPGDTEIIF